MEPIVLQLDGADCDPAEIDDALRVLSQELSEAPDLDVQQHTEPAPPNTKSATGVLLGVAIKLLDSRAAGSAVGVLRDFLSRHRHLKIKVKRGDVEYEVSGASPKELEALLPQLAALGR
jgi:hypothetical protein